MRTRRQRLGAVAVRLVGADTLVRQQQVTVRRRLFDAQAVVVIPDRATERALTYKT